MRISFLILLLNALIFTQLASAASDDTKLKGALLKAMKTHDTATVEALANGGYESIDRDDVLQEKIYEYLDAEREREVQAKTDAVTAKKAAEDKKKKDALAAKNRAKADAVAKKQASVKAAAVAAAAVAAKKAADEKKKKDAIAAKKAADDKVKADAIAKQNAEKKAVAASAAAVAAKKAAEEKKKKAAEEQAKAKKTASKKKVAPETVAKKATPAAPKVKVAPKAVVAPVAAVIAAPVVAPDADEDIDAEEADTDADAEVEPVVAAAPLSVSDKELIGIWKQLSSEKVITLVIEENTNFSLEQVEDDGTLTIMGTWKSEEDIFMLSIKKVQRNVHTRETDIHRIYKVERLSKHRLVLRDKRDRIAYDLKR
ncbi:MAG: hypothetical protein WBG65_12455 [Sulfurimonadaceae bacterium]